MSTLKLKTKPPAAGPKGRAPLRAGAPRPRPTLAQAERERRPAPPPPARSDAMHPPRTEHGRAPEAGSRRSGGPPAPARPDRAQDDRRPRQPPRPPEMSCRDASPGRRPMPAVHDAGMRLSKRMSELGLASRREADEWIAKGWVRVDGRVVAELGSRVLPGQRITIDARARHQQAGRVTILLNKPVGWVSGQAEDGHAPAITLVKPQTQWRKDCSGIRFLREHLRGIAPAGRLDIDSVGLLVFTQDGRIARQLIGDDSEIEKEYLVRVEIEGAGRLPDDKLRLLGHGLELDGVTLRPAEVEWINDDQLRFVLREGRKRQIRRMCEAVGLKVTGLKRVRIGQVLLGDLPAGQWRYLRPDERFDAGSR
ncbi:MAG: rRNA pseudouridine synthase [Burkholderiaceae bacterium]|nr:rRNA pseudouridine synthase [Burkholderiaceae bacterium]